jgi:DNA replication protein DnaC
MIDHHRTRKKWTTTASDYSGDPTFADAICDRIIHNAHKLILAGESMRKTQGGLTDGRTL